MSFPGRERSHTPVPRQVDPRRAVSAFTWLARMIIGRSYDGGRVVTWGSYRQVMDDITSVTASPPGVLTLPRPTTAARGRSEEQGPSLPPILRTARAADEAAIRRIFRSTLFGPLLPATFAGLNEPSSAAIMRAYENLCLDWYFEHGSVIVADDGIVRGYLLACTDQRRYTRWVIGQSLTWALRSSIMATHRAIDPVVRHFVRLRIADGVASAVTFGPANAPMPAHAHLNLSRGVRAAGYGRRLVRRMHQLTAEAGLEGWFGETNLPAGRSPRAFERHGAWIVARTRSRTASWAYGRDMERCTVACPVTTV